MKPSKHTIMLLPLSSTDNFCIVSAYLHEKTAEVNQLSHSQLKTKLINLGYGFIELRSNYNYFHNGIQNQSTDKFLFIRKANLHDMMLLAEKYGQSCVLYKREEVLEVLDSRVGRVLSIFVFRNGNVSDDFKTAYTDYLTNRNKFNDSVDLTSLEKLHIPTSLESMLRLKNKQGLATAEWIELF
ncbi:MAG: hypothetical protein IPP77_10870 [Bacteroidetes bacterium]|nr:hypothetical protein [Bacteroidota bacterium]